MTSLGALRPLQAGDRVALIAPAGPTSAQRQQRAQGLLRQWGLEPVTYPSSTAAHPRAVYLSGADLVRAEDLVEAWCDPAIDGIFCLRGGYGTIRVLDLLDAERMRGAAAKPLFGSSDITAVHEWLRERLGAATWFTPMIGTGSLLDDEVAVASLRAAAFEPVPGRCFAGPRAEPLATGVAHGTVIGGNLSLLTLTVGARAGSVDNSGTIALLEDIGEETYRIDGYLMALLRSGWFNGVAGIALGSWLNCGPLDEIRELCLELLGPLGVPMVWELGFGHGPGALSVPLGVPATLLAERAKVALIVDSQPNRPLM